MPKNQCIPLSTLQTEAVLRRMGDARAEPFYEYPWESLKQKLQQRGLHRLPLVAYGSLLNAVSAARTLREESARRRQPVVAFGARRLFNYRMPLGVTRYGPLANRHARGALNVRVTGEIDDVVSGILVETVPEDIDDLRAREVGYDLVPVACLWWGSLKKPPFLAYILRCPDEARAGERHTDNGIEPHREYYLVCREGAAEFGDDFLRLWLATTFMADGVTSVGAWEAHAFPEIGGKSFPT